MILIQKFFPGFKALFKKEFNQFFSNPMGYIIVVLFLVLNGLLLWFFKGNSNILLVGFADMQSFFDVTPWLFILLIPAITMKSFSEEYLTGSIELLKTRPLTAWQVVLGKFFSTLMVIIISLLPTLIYAFSLTFLAQPQSIDWGSIAGSYFGLLFLASVFTAVGIWTSMFTKNQILSFIVALIINVLLYYGWQQLALWYQNLPYLLSYLGLYEHYTSIGRGVMDSRDLIYFSSVSFFFLWLTKTQYKIQ